MSVMLPAFFGQQAAVTKYELSDFAGENSTRLVDGTQMKLNDDGRVSQIQYASGATVRRHQSYVLVRSSNSSYWFGDANGRWYPID
ncbi:MAG: hypothetical protein U0103_02695 [Candidatus Obscuribacterales bacterium]|jgi:hypothetical protein|nr:hypothetical protein [Cyanobacteria bacterium SZAS LIN-5]RTL40651.1 MAG: hypothetical protein EKK48_15430 [Candidatus Melainabacteria bacterium]